MINIIGNKKQQLFAITLIVILTWGCNQKQYTPQHNVVVAKETKTNLLNPKFVTYNNTLDSTTIYYQLQTQHILYTRRDKQSPYQSKIEISYKLYPYGNSKLVLDSSTQHIKDVVREKTNKTLIGNLRIATKKDMDYLLVITTKDINRGALIVSKIYIDKTSSTNAQFFLLVNDSTQTPLFNSYVTNSDTLLLYSNVNKNNTVFLNLYQRNFKIAPPPFASVSTKAFKHKPDSLIIGQINSKGEYQFAPPPNGFLHIQADTNKRDGLTLFRFNENYPYIKTAKGMIAPLRYICSTAEYNALLNSKNPKKSIDEFWLSKASSKERARNLIKQYYRRVEKANLNFTSYVEGWKTDRGMISIVFGTPSTIRKTLNTETWVYGDENNLIALNFMFTKRSNPFTDNDYKLERSTSYKSIWYRAVDTWRSGRVYYGY